MPALRGRLLRLPGGDDGGGFGGEGGPTVTLLAGGDEDARAGRGHAVPVNVELGDVAIARFGGGQAAEDGEMVDEADACAAWGRAEDYDVRGRSGRDAELEIKRAAGVGDREVAHGAGVEPGTLRRGEDGRETLSDAGGIHF